MRSSFKKFPTWLAVSTGTFVIGIGAVVMWLCSEPIERIKAPACYNELSSFPGNSVDIYDLKSSDRSPYTSSEFFGPIENSILAAFDEKPFNTQILTNGKANEEAVSEEIYRFFWLRTFHNPIVIRAEQISGERFIVAKVANGKSGYDAGQLTSSVSKKLTDSEWCELIRRLDDARFWKKDKIDVNHLANDGAFWIVEGVKAGAKDRRYYVTGEQSPAEGPFRDACVYMMRLSGLPIDENSPDFY